MSETDTVSWTEANEQAAQWHARLDAGTADEQAFETWRAADPRHAAAFARIAAASDLFGDMEPVDLSRDPDLARPRLPRRRVLQYAAAGAALAIGGGVWTLVRSPAHASTVIGERKSLDLPDGVRLDLNTDTKVSWKFSASGRRIWLEKGEVGLLVPEGTACLLYAAGQVVTVERGNLNARLRDAALDLSVFDGRCQIIPGQTVGSFPAPAIITAGESALVADSTPRVRKNTEAEIEFTSGWRQDQLIFDGQTLAVAVDEYNRYLTNKITIVDSGLSGLRLGGRFKSRDPEDFLQSLRTSFGIHVATDDRGAVLLSR